MVYLVLCRKECKSEDATSKISESDPEELSDEASTDTFYGASPPSTPRQMKRMSTKHQKNNVGRPAGRSTLKGRCGVLVFSLSDRSCSSSLLLPAGGVVQKMQPGTEVQ